MGSEAVTAVTPKKKALAPTKAQVMPTVGKNYFIYDWCRMVVSRWSTRWHIIT